MKLVYLHADFATSGFVGPMRCDMQVHNPSPAHTHQTSSPSVRSRFASRSKQKKTAASAMTAPSNTQASELDGATLAASKHVPAAVSTPASKHDAGQFPASVSMTSCLETNI